MRPTWRARWWLLLIATLTLGLVPGVTPAAEQLFFGPTVYTRTAGPPNEFLETIALPPTLAAPFRLHVQNGNPDGSHRISSARITVNGTQVVGPSEFSQNVAGFDRAVTLQANNTLQVRLASTPGSFLVLTLYGTIPPPRLTTLEPPTLPITQGGAGTLTATISASQPTVTAISLRSSNAAIVSAPATVTVPAGATTTQVPVTGLTPGTTTITATLNGSTVNSTVTVQPSGPTLTGLAPATLQITQGASGILTVTLSAAQATDTPVLFTTSNPGVAGLQSGNAVIVPAGQLSQSFAVFGTSPGTSKIDATLNGTTAQSQVTVVIPLPTVVSLVPPSLPLTEGSAGTLIVTLNANQPTDADVFLAASDPTIVGLPADRVTVPAHANSASFLVIGLTRGMATVTASLNGSAATSAVTVTPPPATLQAFACPATLATGATGLCTLTLNATQLTDTAIPLSTTDPGIVSVPASVTIPANALAAKFVVTGGSIGTATVTAGPLNGASRTADLQVLPPPPMLASLVPPAGTLTVSATATLTLSLNATQLTDTAVALAAAPAGILTVPSTVTVPAGSLTAPVTVTGLAPGIATLTAGPLNGSQAQSSLTVNQLPPTVTGLGPGSLSLPKGRVGTLTLTIAPTQPEATVVTFTSTDPTTVEVPSTATVPAGTSSIPIPLLTRNVGAAMIIAGPLNGTTQAATISVTPAELVSLAITPPAPSIAKGQTQAFILMGTLTDGTTQDLTGTATWTSSDEAIVTVTSGGVATGHVVGHATLTAAVGTLSTTAALTVTPPILNHLSMTPTASSRLVGQTIQLTATGTLTDGTTQDLTGVVTWTSSNPTVVSISATGLATALAPGVAIITTTHPEGFTVNATVSVIVPPPTISSFTPPSGKTGTSVTISGRYLDSTSRVAFNGTNASFTILSSSQIITTVPTGAGNGPLTVTTLGGSVTTTSVFLVLPIQDLSVAVEPSAITAIAGTSVNVKVSTISSGGFTGLTTLGTGALPMGVTAAFSTPALGPNASGILTLTISGTTPSPATIEVRASTVIEGTTITRSATATLTVLASGQTVLAGQVRDEDDKPLASVSIKLGGSTITTLGTTDAAGNFLVSIPVAGSQVFLIDGSTANGGGGSYATIPVTVLIQPGVVNTLGFIPHLHVQPTTLPLPVAPATATPVTFAALPDFQVTIPPGVRIIGWDGQANTQIGVRSVSVDRLAVPPLPAGVGSNVVYMFSFGKVGGGIPTTPIPITLPNTTGAYPGQQVELWYFNEAPDGSAPNAWQMFGYGTVSSDGRLIVSNAGVGIPRFCCGAITPRPPQNMPPAETVPQPNPEGCPTCGGPIDLASGIVRVDARDFWLSGRVPLVLSRTYRSLDPTLGPFGVGWRHAYEVFVQAVSADMALLITPENLRPRFAKQADGTFLNNDMPGFRGAHLTKNTDNTWSLRFKGGTIWAFNAAGWLVGQMDRNSNRVLVQRDSQNRVTSVADLVGRELTFTYSGSDLKVQQVTDPLGRTVRYAYDSRNRLTQVTDASGGIWAYSYDGADRLETISDPRGAVTERNTYDSNGRVIRQVQADGGVFQIEYQATAGTLTQVTEIDPSGNKLTYRFNGGRFLTEATDAVGQATKNVRAPGSNLVTSRTDALGRTTRYTYDVSGNVTSLTDALGNAWAFTYDLVFQQLLTSTDPLNQITTFAYDGKGNLTSITDPLGHTTTLTYNEAGQPVTIVDALSHASALEYDAAGNLIATVDPLGNRTERTYDDVSRLIAVKDPRGAVTRFTYDTLDRLLTITDPLGGTTRFAYDRVGNLLTVTDAKNQTTTHTYGPGNRLETRTDPLSRTERFTYDLNGNLKTVTDRKGQVTTHAYDGQNRRIQTDSADGSSISYAYDPVGNLLAATDSLTGTIAHAYDALNRLVSEATPQGTILYAYDPLSRRRTMQASGLQTVSYEYDAASRLTGITQGQQTATLGYDSTNRRTSLLLPNGIIVSYAYDEASRLISQTYAGPQGGLGDLTYNYDPSGNRIATGGSWARSLLPASIPSSSYDQANQQLAFGAINQSFDLNGNLLTQTDLSGTRTYMWDARNRPVEISGAAGSAAFAYDAFGRRISKTINGVPTTFLYDGLDTVRETGGAGEASYLRTLSIDETLIRTDTAGTATYLSDALGSTVALADATATVATTYTYEPFGRTEVTGTSSANSFQFTGRENDGTGLYYYRARYYDPNIGRFISEDPIRFAGSVSLYVYVENRPTIAKDPSGLKILICSRTAFGGHLGNDVNHAYLYNTRNGSDCGMMNPPNSENVNANGTFCREVPGSEGHEDDVMKCCEKKASSWQWKSPSWFPVLHDCHTLVGGCLKQNGLTNPGVPGDRVGCRGDCPPAPLDPIDNPSMLAP